jgi:hypothetical protein
MSFNSASIVFGSWAENSFTIYSRVKFLYLYLTKWRVHRGRSPWVELEMSWTRIAVRRRLGRFGSFKDLPVTMCCADQLPARGESRAQSFVVNTVSGDREGPHWVTFHFPKEEPTEFFDSFGRAPETYHRLFQNVLIANGPQYEFKTFRVQPKDCDPCELFTSSNTDTGTLLWNISWMNSSS